MFELAQRIGVERGPVFEHGFLERAPMFWLGHVFDLFVIAALIVGAVLIVRMLVNRQPSGSRGPVQILEERFARGEIDEEEFRTRRDALKA